MGADQSCPCNGDSNVDFPPDDEETDAIVVARKVPESPTATASAATPAEVAEATSLEKSKSPTGTPVSKSKSRKWAAQPKDGGSSVDLSGTTQVRLELDVWIISAGVGGAVVWYNILMSVVTCRLSFCIMREVALETCT